MKTSGKTGTFAVFKGEDGQFYVRLKAANGRKFNVSEGYTRHFDAKRAMNDIYNASQGAKMIDEYELKANAEKAKKQRARKASKKKAAALVESRVIDLEQFA